MSIPLVRSWYKGDWIHFSYRYPPADKLIKVINLFTHQIELVTWKPTYPISALCLKSEPEMFRNKCIKFIYWQRFSLERSRKRNVSRQAFFPALKTIKEDQPLK